METKNHDTEEVPDGAWWFVYGVLDLAVLALDIGFLIPVICLEVAFWILFGGDD